MLGEPQGIFSKANSGAIPGESSENLGNMWFLLPLALPALVAGKILSPISPTNVCAGQCQVNLDKVSGKHPPLLLQKSQFIFPTEKVFDTKNSQLCKLNNSIYDIAGW